VSVPVQQRLAIVDPEGDPQPDPAGPTPPPAHLDIEPAPVWLQRLSLVVLVLFCCLVGGLVAFIPWMPRFWEQNAWLHSHPAIESVALLGWVRGLISGIGLIDIWIGVSELLHYRDFRG
jgi:hypothetical protein